MFSVFLQLHHRTAWCYREQLALAFKRKGSVTSNEKVITSLVCTQEGQAFSVKVWQALCGRLRIHKRFEQIRFEHSLEIINVNLQTNHE